MFSRKHYQFLARTVSDLRLGAEGSFMAERLADELARDNPRFDKARFVKACGYDSKP